ncbi:hypothetical protein BMS3Abin05_01140 [bacterium BMS3Abin05]|nr:hypothetical protein BMS3Abin05_01140 [bacterium BMS3Abin05]GBE27010.1 hypothetical protein BMS3Bbin03_00930 [bacterium BMS3Bbin03]
MFVKRILNEPFFDYLWFFVLKFCILRRFFLQKILKPQRLRNTGEGLRQKYLCELCAFPVPFVVNLRLRRTGFLAARSSFFLQKIFNHGAHKDHKGKKLCEPCDFSVQGLLKLQFVSRKCFRENSWAIFLRFCCANERI